MLDKKVIININVENSCAAYYFCENIINVTVTFDQFNAYC